MNIYLQLAPADIDFLTRIFEAMDGIGVVSTVDARAGLIKLLVTEHTENEARTMLRHFPRPFTYIIGDAVGP